MSDASKVLCSSVLFAGSVRWCSLCRAAHGGWHTLCPRCGRALGGLSRRAAIKEELVVTRDPLPVVPSQPPPFALCSMPIRFTHSTKLDRNSIMRPDDYHLHYPPEPEWPKLKVLCLVGPIRFREAFYQAYERESLRGQIVLMPIFTESGQLTPDQLRLCGQLHRQKIANSHEILVINVGGYMGDGTRDEVVFARSREIPVRFLVSGVSTG